MGVETVEGLCQRARQAIAQGRIEAARDIYQQALTQKADAPDVHYGLATVSFLMNDLDSAAYHFKEVTRLDPVRPGAYINLGAVYNRLGEYDEAIKALRRGIQLDAQKAEGYYNLGLVFRNKGQHNQAIQAYVEATKINPRMVDAHYNLANLYLEMRRFKEAANHYRHVLTLRPNWDKALHGLRQAEEALAETEAPPPAPEPAAAEAAKAAALNPERVIDPNYHGMLLSHLHQATIESETNGRQFVQILEQEVEPALKDLSTCLLRPRTAAGTLDQCIQKFDSAVQNMRAAQVQLQKTIERVRYIGDRLLKT